MMNRNEIVFALAVQMTKPADTLRYVVRSDVKRNKPLRDMSMGLVRFPIDSADDPEQIIEHNIIALGKQNPTESRPM